MSCSVRLCEQWAKFVWSENISTPIYVDCDKMYWAKVCIQEFWYYLGLIFNLSYLRSTILQATKGLQVVKHFKLYDRSYTNFFCRQTQTNGWVVKVSLRCVADCWGSGQCLNMEALGTLFKKSLDQYIIGSSLLDAISCNVKAENILNCNKSRMYFQCWQ